MQKTIKFLYWRSPLKNWALRHPKSSIALWITLFTVGIAPTVRDLVDERKVA